MNIEVTVIVLAYNHEKWIGKAIESIVSQKTSFRFQLLVHDDCSNDNTKEIIKEYVKKYPDMIVPYYEEENQYSKGAKIIQDILVPLIESPYLCLCEGDDYWIDSFKLEKQFQYMRTHPKCTYSFSNAVIVDTENNVWRDFYPRSIWRDKDLERKLNLSEGADFNVEEMLRLDFTPTASIMYKTSSYKELEKIEYTLDLIIRLVCTSNGYAHYFNEKMTAYRIGNPNSASGSIKKDKEKFKNEFLNLHCKLLDLFDEYSNYKYHDAIITQKERKLMVYYLHFFDFKRMRKLSVFNEVKFWVTFKVYLQEYCNPIFKALRKIRIQLYQKNILSHKRGKEEI